MAARADELSSLDASGSQAPGNYVFTYLAEADVFEANVTLPVAVNTNNENGTQINGVNPGHKLLHAQPLPANQQYFSFASAYSEVSAQFDAVNQGYRTIATAVITGLNILNVLTADKVVGQMSTFYPIGDAVPTVNFIGTQFLNLCINTEPLTLDQNLGIFGDGPANDGSYFDDTDVTSAISAQTEAITDNPALPVSLQSQFTANAANANVLECSLVSSVSGSTAQSFGNIIVVPGFGTIYLADVELTRTKSSTSPDGFKYLFGLEMMRIVLQGGPGTGTIIIGALDTNGTGNGSGPHPAPPARKPKGPAQ